MTLAHRSYLIHRSYYVKSFRDRTYAKSHAACVQAASDIIMLGGSGLPATFYRLWNTTVWLVAAGIVLSLDLLQAADAKRVIHDAAARRVTLSNLVELLYNSGDTTGISARGAALITHLARAETEIITGSRTGIKFTRDDIVELMRQSETGRWQPSVSVERFASASNSGSVPSRLSESPLASINAAGRGIQGLPIHRPEPTPWVNPDGSGDMFMFPDNNILSFLDELFPQAQ
jgi:hypothetical protein